MKHIAIAILAVSCIDLNPAGTGHLEQQLIGTVGADENPLTFWWYAGNGQELRPAIECALSRIRAATCLPVDISFDAAHWVRQKAPEDMGGQLGWTTGGFASSRIALKTGMGPNSNCRVLVHEIAQHILQRRNDDGHVDPKFQLSAELLTNICAIRACACFNPESEDNPIPASEYDWECTGVSQCTCDP